MGRRIQGSGLARLTIWRSEDEGDTWTLVAPEDIPKELNDPDVVDFLISGCVAQLPGELTYYAGLHNYSKIACLPRQVEDKMADAISTTVDDEPKLPPEVEKRLKEAARAITQENSSDPISN